MNTWLIWLCCQLPISMQYYLAPFNPPVKKTGLDMNVHAGLGGLVPSSLAGWPRNSNKKHLKHSIYDGDHLFSRGCASMRTQTYQGCFHFPLCKNCPQHHPSFAPPIIPCCVKQSVIIHVGGKQTLIRGRAKSFDILCRALRLFKRMQESKRDRKEAYA